LEKNNDIRKIYYENKNYYNLESYIKNSLLHKISIIYTFNNITDLINGVKEFSRFKMISEIKSEIKLLTEINNIIEEMARNKNEKIIFIHFDESNSKIIGYLISFIKINFEENKEIKFIFIVHIKRNFIALQNEEKKLDKIYVIPDINPDINQLFIDNLNGPNISIQEILPEQQKNDGSKKDNDIIKNLIKKGILKLEIEFKNVLNHFTENLNLKGEDNIISEDNYFEKLEDYFNNNKHFMKCIIDKITDFIIEQKEIDNIIEKIYKSKKIN
jgi:hypothetical protein